MSVTSKIHPIAPSSPFSLEDFEAGVRILQSLGHDVIGPVPLRNGDFSYLNGSDDKRLAELQHALDSNEYDFIWTARGGYGLTRILPALVTPTQKNPPVVIGISDTSALLFHLWAQRRIKSIHAMPITKIANEPAETVEALSLILSGDARKIQYPNIERYKSSGSSIEGDLLVGNLCMLTHLIGTQSMPSLKNSILLLEEVGERPYRIDRMLTHLWASRSLDGVKAVIVGHLTKCQDQEKPTPTALDVFMERLTAFGIPVFGQIPVGHESPNWPIPFGAKARIVSHGDQASLQILDEVVHTR